MKRLVALGLMAMALASCGSRTQEPAALTSYFNVKTFIPVTKGVGQRSIGPVDFAGQVRITLSCFGPGPLDVWFSPPLSHKLPYSEFEVPSCSVLGGGGGGYIPLTTNLGWRRLVISAYVTTRWEVVAQAPLALATIPPPPPVAVPLTPPLPVPASPSPPQTVAP
jgi:hypothetical protein